MDLVIAEALIRSGRSGEALDIINGEVWKMLIQASGPESVEATIFNLWFRGVALERLGQSEEALGVLEEARHLSNTWFRSWHPVTASITYAYILSVLNSPSKRVISESLVDDADKSIAVLRLAYPDQYPSVTAASVVLEELKKPEVERDRKSLLNLRRLAPFL
jgi:hypothetical protein